MPGRPRRQPSPYRRRVPESTVQKQCIEYALRMGALVVRVNVGATTTDEGRFVPWVRWWAPGLNGEQRAGVSDLLIFWRQWWFACECKAPDHARDPSPSQWTFLDAAHAAGAIVVVAYDVQDLVVAMAKCLQ